MMEILEVGANSLLDLRADSQNGLLVNYEFYIRSVLLVWKLSLGLLH